MGHIFESGRELVVFLTRHYRIHKETPGVSDLFGVGQLLATNIYNGLSELLGGGTGYSSLFQGCADVPIVELRLECASEAERNSDD